jgi:hypothetical protein
MVASLKNHSCIHVLASGGYEELLDFHTLNEHDRTLLIITHWSRASPSSTKAHMRPEARDYSFKSA